MDSVATYESALKDWVREEEDIWHVLSYPSHQILKIASASLTPNEPALPQQKHQSRGVHRRRSPIGVGVAP